MFLKIGMEYWVDLKQIEKMANPICMSHAQRMGKHETSKHAHDNAQINLLTIQIQQLFVCHYFADDTDQISKVETVFCYALCVKHGGPNLV